jgi:hypothetical protein
VAFDSDSVAALLAQLTARTVAGSSLSITVAPTLVAYVDSRVPGASLLRPRGQPPFWMISARAVYRSPDRLVPLVSAPVNGVASPQKYSRFGGLQRTIGPAREDTLRLSIVVDEDPAMVLVGKGLLLTYLQAEFFRIDQLTNQGLAPVRVP